MIPDLFVRMEVTEVRFDMGKNMYNIVSILIIRIITIWRGESIWTNIQNPYIIC